MGINFKYTKHARDRMRLRKVSRFEIENTILYPNRQFPDPDDEEKTHAVRRWPSRTLDVVYVSGAKEIRVITVIVR